MWVKQIINLPPDDYDEDDELDERIEKAERARKKTVQRGNGIHGT